MLGAPHAHAGGRPGHQPRARARSLTGAEAAERGAGVGVARVRGGVEAGRDRDVAEDEPPRLQPRLGLGAALHRGAGGGHVQGGGAAALQQGPPVAGRVHPLQAPALAAAMQGTQLQGRHVLKHHPHTMGGHTGHHLTSPGPAMGPSQVTLKIVTSVPQSRHAGARTR